MKRAMVDKVKNVTVATVKSAKNGVFGDGCVWSYLEGIPAGAVPIHDKRKGWLVDNDTALT